MVDFSGLFSNKLAIPILVVGVAGLMVLFFWNPAETTFYPKCPFFMLTGYKCPGCGTLRGIHALLHLRIMDALHYNLFMVVSIPVLVAMLFSRKLRFSVWGGRLILFATFIWWLVRNIV